METLDVTEDIEMLIGDEVFLAEHELDIGHVGAPLGDQLHLLWSVEMIVL